VKVKKKFNGLDMSEKAFFTNARKTKTIGKYLSEE